MFLSRFMPCSECGASVERSAASDHQCDPDRLVDFKVFGMRHEVGRLETSFHDYLNGPEGRFEVWAAARHVRRTD